MCSHSFSSHGNYILIKSMRRCCEKVEVHSLRCVCTAREFVAVFCAGQLVESLGGGRDGQDVLVSLFSVFSAAGRLACGSIPERLLQRHGLPR